MGTLGGADQFLNFLGSSRQIGQILAPLLLDHNNIFDPHSSHLLLVLSYFFYSIILFSFLVVLCPLDQEINEVDAGFNGHNHVTL